MLLAHQHCRLLKLGKWVLRICIYCRLQAAEGSSQQAPHDSSIGKDHFASARLQIAGSSTLQQLPHDPYPRNLQILPTFVLTKQGTEGEGSKYCSEGGCGVLAGFCSEEGRSKLCSAVRYDADNGQGTSYELSSPKEAWTQTPAKACWTGNLDG